MSVRQYILLLLLLLLHAISIQAAGFIPEAPIKVRWIDIYSDGGTIGLILVDGAGREFKMCIDGRMTVFKHSRDAYRFKPQPKQVYIGVTHPEHPGAVALPVAGSEENKTLVLLERWLTDHVPVAEQNRLAGLPNLEGLTQTDIDRKRIVLMVRYLRGRNAPSGK